MQRYFIHIQPTTGIPTTASQYPLSVTSTVKPIVLLEKKITPAKHQFVAKFCTSCIGVGHTLKYSRFQDHAKCPCCKHEEERSIHVLLCPDKRTERQFQNNLQEISNTSLRKNENKTKIVSRNT